MRSYFKATADFSRQIILIFTLFTATSYSIHARADVRFGNGGEGLERDGVLKLRDFFKNGVYHEPKVNLSRSTRVNFVVWNSRPLPLNQQILDSKLIEFSKVSGVLAQSISEIIGSCWTASGTGVWIVDPSDVAAEGFQRVPIAVRGFPFGSCVSLDRSAWNRLSEIDKVGLLVHEAVSSLLNPTCGSSLCGQNSKLVREIVSFLFYADEVGAKYLPERFAHELGLIDSAEIKPSDFHIMLEGDPGMEDAIRVRQLVSTNVVKKDIGQLASIWLSTGLPALRTKACQALRGGKETDVLEIKLDRSPICIKESYTSARRGQGQIVMNSGTRLKSKTILLPKSVGESCEAVFDSLVENWFGDLFGVVENPNCF